MPMANPPRSVSLPWKKMRYLKLRYPKPQSYFSPLNWLFLCFPLNKFHVVHAKSSGALGNLEGVGHPAANDLHTGGAWWHLSSLPNRELLDLHIMIIILVSHEKPPFIPLISYYYPINMLLLWSYYPLLWKISIKIKYIKLSHYYTIIHYIIQGGAPRTIAKLVNITPITMVFIGDISIVNGVYKPIYN